MYDYALMGDRRWYVMEDGKPLYPVIFLPETNRIKRLLYTTELWIRRKLWSNLRRRLDLIRMLNGMDSGGGW